MSERRTTVYIIGVTFLTLLLVLAAYLGRAFLESGVNEGAWARQNELVLSSLPLYPGATETGESYSTGEPEAGAPRTGPYRGYWTTHSYTLPLGARPDLVLAFYSQNLPDWRSEPVQGSTCELTYRRVRAMLDLKACGSLLTVSANYHEYGA